MRKFKCRNCGTEFEDCKLRESHADKRFMKYKCKNCNKVNLIPKRELENETKVS